MPAVCVDPRRGRGFFNTYPAGLPGLRYPWTTFFIRTTSQCATCAFFRVLNRTICRSLRGEVLGGERSSPDSLLMGICESRERERAGLFTPLA